MILDSDALGAFAPHARGTPIAMATYYLFTDMKIFTSWGDCSLRPSRGALRGGGSPPYGVRGHQQPPILTKQDFNRAIFYGKSPAHMRPSMVFSLTVAEKPSSLFIGLVGLGLPHTIFLFRYPF
jgi:hypothetical protein